MNEILFLKKTALMLHGEQTAEDKSKSATVN